MEINELSNNAFDFHETAMDDQQILHYNQINDLDSLLPYFPFQPYNIIDHQQHLPSSFSSSQLLSTPLPLDTPATDQDHEPEQEEELGAMKEMMYKIAAMQPVDIDPSTIRKPKRRNVRISDDPQSIAARLRRERISEKIRILQRLVPGGTKMDTASMLDEAIRYVKFLKRQIRMLQSNQPPPPQPSIGGSSSTATVGWPFTIHKGNVSMGEKSLY